MMPATTLPIAGPEPIEEMLTVARNVSARYLAIAVEMIIGLIVLPFNVEHLGKAAYGLWMLAGSITAYFSIVDLGYSGALVRFVAHYRAKRDVAALNEILSTAFCLFTGLGIITYVLACVVALSLGQLFHLAPDQVYLGRVLLLVFAVYTAIGMAFSVFGAVVNGFQLYHVNNVVGIASSVITAVVNVAVLQMGYGLVELVVTTTTVRLLTYGVYRANAYRVFPAMRLRVRSFSRARLRELTTFSVYMLLIDWANKLNYSVDVLIVGAFLNTTAVAAWAVAQRLAEMTQRLTNQFNEVLFPTIVDHHTASRLDRLQHIFLLGTRLSLATVIPIGGTLMLVARPLIEAWVGPEFIGSAIVVQLLVLTVIARVGNATASVVLKGAGRHRLVAFGNIAAAVVNVSLSVALVRSWGLAGVAIGTLVPIGAVAMLIVFPAGCRRVHVPLRRAFVQAVWPALWPAAVMAAYVEVTLPLIGLSLPAVGLEMIAAVSVYAVRRMRGDRHGTAAVHGEGTRNHGAPPRARDVGGRVRGIILAAGRGGRLRGVTGDHPKCLARVGTSTLLERQLAALRSCGVGAVTVVAGHRVSEVQRVAGSAVDIVENPRFASTNSLYSLWLARKRLTGGFVVLNCDVLFHTQLLVDLLTARYEDALLVAPRAASECYSDEEMKVRIRSGCVVDIAKTISNSQADGENVGIAKFGADGARILIEELTASLAAGARREWLPAAFAAFSCRRALHAIDNRGLPWIEIDTPEDYWRACSDVLPAIEQREGRHRLTVPTGADAVTAPFRRSTHHV
jgi:O-antigen/teichoic acid export membrane protein/choline kinase